MARKNLIPGYKAFDAVNATINQTQAIESTVSGCDKACYHLVFSTANSGEIFIEARNSENDVWYDLDFGAPMVITAETDVVLNVNQINFHQMRLVWEPSSGAGTLTAILTSASEGA